MKRKIWIAAGTLAFILVLAGIWLLDIPNWKQLDRNLLEHLQNASVVYDRDGNEAFTLYGAQKRRTVSIDALPKHVPQAFVAAEDQRFYEHGGIDIRRIFGAALNNLRSGELEQGASTITQQLIKLTHLSSEKTYRRKIQEAFLAMQAERVYTKDDILGMYMNVIYFGSGAYGIEMAANTYFGKPAAELTISEAALLAGVIKSPNSYSPKNSMEKALARRDYVLSQMLECGYITDAEFDQAKQSPVQLADTADEGISGWYRDSVITEAADILHISAEELLGGGYRIYTSLDMDMQRQADLVMSDNSAFPADGVECALIAVDPSDGGVLAVCGGRNDGVRMALNRALDSRRQPGSVIKPVSVYAAAIDSGGYLPSAFVDDTQRVFADGYMPRNAGDNYYGMVTLRTALSRSLNVATVALAEQVGVAAMRNYARRFGIPVDDDDASLALALGSMTYGVTPAQMAGAYASLSNGGLSAEVHLITRITDSAGKELYSQQIHQQRIISENTAALLTDMLCTAADEGSAHALSGAGIPVAGKTGTVSADGGTRDAWTVAYTPEVSVAVWMGYDSAAEGVMADSVSGSGYPARIAAAWLKAVSPQLEGRDFDLPDSLEKVSLDRISLETDHIALLAGEYTPEEERVDELFPAGKAPDVISGRFQAPESAIQAEIAVNAMGFPVIRFTTAQDGMEYILLRHQDGQIVCLAEMTGAAGQTLEYADTNASLMSAADYQIVVRQADLYGRGTLLTESSDTMLHFEPLMARLGRFGAETAQPEPSQPVQESLFAP